MQTEQTDNEKSLPSRIKMEDGKDYVVEETEEGYPLNYIVNIHNPSNCTIHIWQTGKPSGGDPPPGGSK